MTQPDLPPLSTHPADPFTAVVQGWSASNSLEDWPNTVSVSVITAAAGDPAPAGEDDYYADSHGERELVEIDTNYKPTRTSDYPVRLTRIDAIQLVVHLLQATEDTFHYARRGQLRGAEAAELLRALQEVDYALSELRGHALDDLVRDTGADPDEQPETNSVEEATVPAASSAVEIEAARLTAVTDAIREIFTAQAAGQMQGSDAFGALVYRVRERAAATGLSPVEVLRELDADDRSFALRADDPAAFLAAKVRDLPDEAR